MVGRTPHGVRGLKFVYVMFIPAFLRSRTPHGVRGLKCTCRHQHKQTQKSHPAWGAWIEMLQIKMYQQMIQGRTPHGVRGLKSKCQGQDLQTTVSHPAWGAWIEIILGAEQPLSPIVAPRMGCVD